MNPNKNELTIDALLTQVSEMTDSKDMQMILTFVELSLAFLSQAIFVYSEFHKEGKGEADTHVTVDPELIDDLLGSLAVGINVMPYLNDMENEHGKDSEEGDSESGTEGDD